MSRPLCCLTILAWTAVAAAQDRTPLSAGDTAQGTLATGDVHTYTLASTGDDFVRGHVNQATVDVVVRILRPDGRAIATIDGPARGPEPFQFETELEGEYVIEVTPFEEETGDYAVAVERLEPVASDPEQLADQLLSAYAGDDTPGAAVAVWRDGETLFARAYGMANLVYDVPFALDTPTNIGSTSKQFTAFALLLLEQRGELSLDDDVRQHLPELPDLGETVTIRHLLTHTTGYREFLNLLMMTGRRLDHGDHVDRAELIRVVQDQPALQNAPGAEWNYNNTAFGLAARIVERVSGQSFPEFLDENVFEPLGMHGTQVRASPEQIVRGRSAGYVPEPAGGYREVRDLGGALGAGAIYTTVGDLQTWIENYTRAELGTREMLDEMMTSYVLTDGAETGYGLGLFIDDQGGLKRVHHGGGDAAHRSQLVYFPEIDAGLTTQSNHAGFDGSIAFRLCEAFFADAMELEDDEAEGGDGAGAGDGFDPERYDPEDFDEFVGRYALDVKPDFILSFFREGDTLYTQATNQPKVEIVPTSETNFKLLVVEASVTFHRNEDGEVDSATLHQGGDNKATRLPDDEPEAAPPVLADFTGRYYSDELETFFEVALDGDALVLRQRRMDARKLSHGSGDDFSGGGLSLAFERDRNGRVIGLYVSNGRTRDVRFARVGEASPPRPEAPGA